MGGYGHVTNNMANMNFFFVKNSWYFIVAEWPTGPGGEDKKKSTMGPQTYEPPISQA